MVSNPVLVIVTICETNTVIYQLKVSKPDNLVWQAGQLQYCSRAAGFTIEAALFDDFQPGKAQLLVDR